MSDTLQFVVVIRKTQVTSQPDSPASRRQTEVCRTLLTHPYWIDLQAKAYRTFAANAYRTFQFPLSRASSEFQQFRQSNS